LLTPLHYCAREKKHEVARILVEYNSLNINSRDIDGMTPLHYAAACNDLNMIQVLIEKPGLISLIKNIKVFLGFVEKHLLI